MTIPTQDDRVQVTYHKSNAFRVVYAEGCYGGLSPRGMITSSFYNERAPIPKTGVFTVIDGAQGPEEIVDGLSGVVREVEVNVVMDINAATSYYVWLRDKLEVLRAGIGIPDEQWQKMIGEKK